MLEIRFGFGFDSNAEAVTVPVTGYSARQFVTRSLLSRRRPLAHHFGLRSTTWCESTLHPYGTILPTPGLALSALLVYIVFLTKWVWNA